MGLLANAVALLGAGVGTTVRRLKRGPRRPAWSWRYEMTVALLKALNERVIRQGPAAHREAYEALVLPSAALKQVQCEPVSAGGVPGVWFIPPEPDESVVLYLHGGAYVMGSTRTHGDLMARLALASGKRVLGLDYRLAPEQPFPAALEDAVKAWRWLLSLGIAPEQAVVAGDSAGGGLCVAAMLTLRGRGVPLPAGGVLLAPWVDLACTGDSLTRHARWDWGDRRMAERWASWYLGGASPLDPLASPLYADLRGLPPLHIQVGSLDVLHDEVTRFARAASDAGVAVELDVWPDMVHDFQTFGAEYPESAAATEKLAERIRAFTVAAPRLKRLRTQAAASVG